MASRTSLTGVAVNSGYVQILIVGDDGGITSTKTLIYDGNGTATSLLLGTVDAEFVLGTSAGNDFLVGNGSDILLIEGDTVKFTFTGDATAGSDFEINDGTNALVLVETDTDAFTFTGDATAGSDFIIHDGTNPMVTVATDDNTTLYQSGHQFLFGANGLQIGNGASDKLSFYDISTPVVQPLKASFNSWAAATDVAGALAALGLVDQA